MEELDDLPDLEEAGGHQEGDCVVREGVDQRDQFFGAVLSRGTDLSQRKLRSTLTKRKFRHVSQSQTGEG